ncbi:MAG: DNA polymerase beta domain-containing protein [Candidatus Magnetoglobus multicellularis str. Araruama]|uniref:DNA polymerase beta domain-containing protein n=1 Tax=Candidatus Magnetoglobus multicellularis str. Araruama TaxID=890399 RepID=A0A1V1PE64_9BACT|nr:MAG: DNA polymerase beta domain-containing protein [Candidatus Magnetoglobus multicellularis str. Araruama]
MKQKKILDILSEYKKQNSEKYGIVTLGLFGSTARNQYNENSDLDICIKTKEPNPFIIVNIKSDIEQLFNKKIDIVRVREKMNPFLKARIDKEAIYVR